MSSSIRRVDGGIGGFAIAATRLALLDRRSRRLRVMGARWDRSVHAPLAWTPDSTAVLFLAEDDARQHLYRFEMGRAAPEPIVRGGVVSDFATAGGSVAFV